MTQAGEWLADEIVNLGPIEIARQAERTGRVLPVPEMTTYPLDGVGRVAKAQRNGDGKARRRFKDGSVYSSALKQAGPQPRLK